MDTKADVKYAIKLLESLLADQKKEYNNYKQLIKNLDATKDIELNNVEKIVRKHCYKSYVDLKKYYYKEIQNTKKYLKAAKQQWHDMNRA